MAGNLWVGLFFFFTGYGLKVSLATKPYYLDDFVRKKFVMIYLPFMFAELFYCLAYLFVGNTLNWKTVLECIIGVKLINSVLWYVVEIFAIYLLFYILQKMKMKNDWIFWISVYIMFMLIATALDVGNWWYLSTGCLLIGLYIDKILEVFLSVRWVEIFSIAMFVLFYIVDKLLGYFAGEYIGIVRTSYVIVSLEILLAPLFVFVCIYLSERIRFKKYRLFSFLGMISYEIYLYHMVVSLVLHKWIHNQSICIVSSVVCTILFSWLVHKAYKSFILRRKIE